MLFRGHKVKGFFLLDQDNNDQPQTMISTDESVRFYACPDNPAQYMSASQVRDVINIVASVSGRIGGSKDRMQWYMQIADHELLYHLENFNELTDE